MGKSRPAPSRVVGTASPTGALVHLANTDATLLYQNPETQVGTFDRVEVWACNVDAANDRIVDIFFGSDDTGAPVNQVTVQLAKLAGMQQVIPGFPLERGLPVYAQATTAATINLATLVNPVPPST